MGPFNQYLIVELADIVQVEVQSVVVESPLNLKTGDAVVNGNQAPNLGLIELLVFLGVARHDKLGFKGVYCESLFDYNLPGARRRPRILVRDKEYESKRQFL